MIDTADKRRSAAGVAFLPLGPGVTPDSSEPVAWRQQAAWGYSGIAADIRTLPIIYDTIYFAHIAVDAISFNAIKADSPVFAYINADTPQFARST